MLDLERAFRLPFKDPAWTSRIGLGAVIQLVPILNIALPIILVGCGLYAAWFGFVFSFIPLSSSRSGPGSEAILAWTAGMMAASFGFTCVFFLLYLYLIAIMVLIPLTRVQMLRTGSVAACLRLGDLLRLFRERPGEYLGASLMLAGSAYAGSLLSILGPLLLLVTPYAAIVTGHVFGQLARATPAPAMPIIA